MARPARKYVTTDYGQMHVRVSNSVNQSNTALVCLHMMPQSGQNFEDVMQLACSDRMVVAPDYHGYGESDPPPDTKHITIADYARTNWQCLDQLGLHKVDLVGHHTGSKVAIEMGRQRQQHVRSIVLISTLLGKPENKGKQTEFVPLKLDREGDWLGNWWQELQAYYPSHYPVELILKQYADTLKPGLAFRRGFAASQRYNQEYAQALESLEHPISVINPNDDLYEMTPKVMTHIQNGTLIDKPDWEPGFLNTHADDVTNTVLSAIRKMTG